MGSHAGRLALAGLLDGPFITIERGPKIKHGSSIFKLCHNRGLTTLFLVPAPHHHQQRCNKGQKGVIASPTKGCNIGQKKSHSSAIFKSRLCCSSVICRIFGLHLENSAPPSCDM